MLDLPSRTALTALGDRAAAAVPCRAVGFVRALDDARAWLLQVAPNGVSAHVVPLDSLPPALRPGVNGVGPVDSDALQARETNAVEWQLTFYGVKRVVATALPDASPTRLWIGRDDDTPPSAAQAEAFRRVAATAAGMLDEPLSPDAAAERYRRLDLAAELIPTLLHVLDVREVFNRISATANRALPHDLLMLRVFSEDLTSNTVFARSGEAPVIGPPVSHVYPPAVIRAWEYSIIDDMSRHVVEGDGPLAAMGARSTLRLPIRFGGRVIGGLAFLSHAPNRFASTDVAVGRRLADHVASALSHHHLAEESRRAAALRARADSLDMLDGLLDTLTGVLDIREVFARVSDVTRDVLPHDGISILELRDGGTARMHASHGLGDVTLPFDVPLPVPTLELERHEVRIIPDYRDRPEYASGPGVRAGMRSSLFVTIRLDGKTWGGVNFYSRTPSHFSPDDAHVARRVADHIALALSHSRLADQVRITEELRARASNLDLLDASLASLMSTGELADVFANISTVAATMLPHDVALLMVRLPDGVRARLYASSTKALALPSTTQVPEELIDNPNWEYDIFDDLTAMAGRYQTLVGMGFKSLLRVPIRLEGKFAGALVFLAHTTSGFTPADVPVARRIADRLAVSLAHDREVDAERRADEATERASRLEARVRALTDELDARTGYRRVVGESKPWRQVLTQAAQVAATETTALLLGESGTGKEVVARFVHRASPRSGGPFVALNCAALPEQLLEAELFGYERGAFTGATQSKPGQLELAAGGTLFLDEVGEMSLPAQAKFLRVLQEREFQRLGGTRVLRSEARVVAATNRDLSRAIANGQFREDLYYRLNVFAIRLPALRDRPDDILPLAEAFLTEIGRGLGPPPGGISKDAREMLVASQWPGNVRELRNILERAAILCEGGLITAEYLGLNLVAPVRVAPAPVVAAVAATPAAPALPVAAPPSSAEDLATIEKAMIDTALQNARFNKSKAAKALGMTRHQLYIRMRKHGLE